MRLITAMGAALALGCTGSIGNLTLASSQYRPDHHLGRIVPIADEPVVERDCSIKWNEQFWPSIEDAVRKAEKRTGADALANVKVTISEYTYILVNQYCIGIEGTPVRFVVDDEGEE